MHKRVSRAQLRPPGLAEEVRGLPSRALTAFATPRPISPRELVRSLPEVAIFLGTVDGVSGGLDHINRLTNGALYSNDTVFAYAFLGSLVSGSVAVYGLRRIFRGSIHTPLF